jgi:transcription elongation factor GreA
MKTEIIKAYLTNGKIDESAIKSAAEIIKSGGAKDIVSVGKKVKVLDIDFDETCLYELVGTTEADISKNKISNESPLGKALIGGKAGEMVTVKAPQGVYKVKIVSIED